jgi:hypothetical protein
MCDKTINLRRANNDVVTLEAMPPGVRPVALTVRFDVELDELGAVRSVFGAPKESVLVAKYGGSGKALAACRDLIVESLDILIEEFEDDEF